MDQSEMDVPVQLSVSLESADINVATHWFVEAALRSSKAILPATFNVSRHVIMFDTLKLSLKTQKLIGHTTTAKHHIRLNQIHCSNPSDFAASSFPLDFSSKTISIDFAPNQSVVVCIQFIYSPPLLSPICDSPIDDCESFYDKALQEFGSFSSRSTTPFSSSPSGAPAPVRKPPSPPLTLDSTRSGSSLTNSSYTSFSSNSSKSSFSILSEHAKEGLREFKEIYWAFKSTGWDNISKLDFAKGVLLVQAFYRANPIPKTGRLLDASKLRVGAYFMDFCIPTYGALAMTCFGYTGGKYLLSSAPDRNTAIHHMNIPKEHLLDWEFSSSDLVHKPNFFVAYDERTRSIVVSIRGTFSLHEAIVDGKCEYSAFHEGLGHKGMIEAAEFFKENHMDAILGWAKQYNATAIYIVGHSMGASIGSLFLIKYRKLMLSILGEDFTIQGINFATPPCVCKNVQLSSGSHEYIENYVNCNDFVPQLSYGTLLDLRDLIVKAASISSLKQSKEYKLELLKEFKQANLGRHPHLYIPGKVYHIYKCKNSGRYVAEETEAAFFTSIGLRKNMFTDHFVNNYDSNIRRAHDQLKIRSS